MTFEDLIKTYGDMVWRVALSHERNVAVAEELYQDICCALWEARHRIDDADSPRAYVARIAMNTSISHVRREVRQPETVETAEEPGQTPAVDEALHRYHQQEQLLAAVQELPLNWRQPVTLTLEGFKPQEIAYVMGTSANTISLRLSRAKKALRDLINPTEHDDDDK